MYFRAWECLRSVVDIYNTTKRNDFPCVVRTWYIFFLFKFHFSSTLASTTTPKKKANKTNIYIYMYIYIYHKSVNFQQPVDWWTLRTVQYDNPIDLFTMGDLFVTIPLWQSKKTKNKKRHKTRLLHHPRTVLCLKSLAPKFWICLGDKIFSSDMVKEGRFLDKRKK